MSCPCGKQKDNKPDSWMSLLKGMRSTLKAKKFKQVPQLSTSRELDISQPFALSAVILILSFGDVLLYIVCL